MWRCKIIKSLMDTISMLLSCVKFLCHINAMRGTRILLILKELII